MSETSSWMVILSRPTARDPMALAKALAAARKTPLQDQMMAAKSSWGILAENLSEAKAKILVEALRGSGIESMALPSSSLSALPEPTPSGTFDLLAAVKPLLLAASAITITSTTTKSVKEGPSASQKVLSTAILLGTGLPIHIGGKTRIVEKTQHHSDVAFYLDIIFEDPLRRVRIDAQRFDYSFLKERKLYQILGNFKLLVADLVKAAPEAWRTHGTNVLLEGKQIQTMGYASLADVEREMRWLLTLRSR